MLFITEVSNLVVNKVSVGVGIFAVFYFEMELSNK